MAEMTLDELKGFLLRAVGEDDSVDLAGDILDQGLTDLGFDSLAVIDTTSKVEQHYGVKLPEEVASGVTTPRELLDAVNNALSAAA
ncbi:acyl carrier protein [Streptomyces sp. NPDC050256]|uniref:acyl carrier protein n=1 Tax=unclassified Streptomyces TaxID=2593676 RepID=UPI0011CDD094|nr:acyl carrier protein [Streptomyces sp. or43]TXS39161.1 acyl carrier protein [Streptomyces sp. or43]